MDQSDSVIDSDNSSESDRDRKAEMEEATEILEQYVSETPTSELNNEVYTARLSGGELAFVESIRERLNTNKGETIRLAVNLAAAHLQEVGKREQTVRALDEISTQLDRIEERLDRDGREGATSSEQEQTQAKQTETDWDDIDLDEFEHPGEGVDVDLPDPDNLE